MINLGGNHQVWCVIQGIWSSSQSVGSTCRVFGVPWSLRKSGICLVFPLTITVTHKVDMLLSKCYNLYNYITIISPLLHHNFTILSPSFHMSKLLIFGLGTSLPVRDGLMALGFGWLPCTILSRRLILLCQPSWLAVIHQYWLHSGSLSQAIILNNYICDNHALPLLSIINDRS